MNLTSNGYQLDTAADAFGRLTDSSPLVFDTTRLRSALSKDGYLFLRDVIDPRTLIPLFDRITQRLRTDALIGPALPSSLTPPLACPQTDFYSVLDELSACNEGKQLTLDIHLCSILKRIFDGDVKSFDYVWPRAASPGRAAPPHCDWVYMGRGSQNIVTAWVPLTDMPQIFGPIMLLENSHKHNVHTRKYLTIDADRLGFLNGIRLKHGRLIRGGQYSAHPERVRRECGTRWLSEDFRLGDVLLFLPSLLHATLDNCSASFRLSVDMRFQPAREKADPRFTGHTPIGHAERQLSIFDTAIYRWLRRLTRREKRLTEGH